MSTIRTRQLHHTPFQRRIPRCSRKSRRIRSRAPCPGSPRDCRLSPGLRFGRLAVFGRCQARHHSIQRRTGYLQCSLLRLRPCKCLLSGLLESRSCCLRIRCWRRSRSRCHTKDCSRSSMFQGQPLHRRSKLPNSCASCTSFCTFSLHQGLEGSSWLCIPCLNRTCSPIGTSCLSRSSKCLGQQCHPRTRRDCHQRLYRRSSGQSRVPGRCCFLLRCRSSLSSSLMLPSRRLHARRSRLGCCRTVKGCCRHRNWSRRSSVQGCRSTCTVSHRRRSRCRWSKLRSSRH